MTSAQEANKKIVKRAFDAWDQGRAEIFDEVYAENAAHPQMNLDDDVPVLLQMKRLLQSWVEAFPDQTHDVHHMIAEGDWVATRFSMTGTHLGTWKEIEPTGAHFEVEGMALERVKEGKRPSRRRHQRSTRPQATRPWDNMKLSRRTRQRTISK